METFNEKLLTNFSPVTKLRTEWRTHPSFIAINNQKSVRPFSFQQKSVRPFSFQQIIKSEINQETFEIK